MPPTPQGDRPMTRTLGLIGAGNIGSALARLAVNAGLNVVVSNSRGPETLAGLVAELGEQARAATPAEAAQAGDLVVATVPLNTYEQLPAAALAGKTVIDTMNYYPERDGRIAELDSGEQTSSALVQRHLADSRVVKAFNSIDFIRLFSSARPAGADDRSALPIAGDDPAAKVQVAELLDVLGYDAVDIGTLADSWRSEPGTPVYVQPYLPARPDGLTDEEMGRWFFEVPGVPVPADKVRELADTAVRRPAGDARATLG
ncbi:NADPH-dependent F420 reductase [Streptomyces xylophagus]|uniref:NADPH-dependent F420 reductase n=1 Tax=Streptomyces xylophagus TaxID=285514 RepID=UPI002D2191A5|nr:NAD(P)-binding domain-containing protein [Streptomyces xylophagus]